MLLLTVLAFVACSLFLPQTASPPDLFDRLIDPRMVGPPPPPTHTLFAISSNHPPRGLRDDFWTGVATPPPDGDDMDDLEDLEGDRDRRRRLSGLAPGTPQSNGGEAARSASDPSGGGEGGQGTSAMGWEIAGLEVARAEEVRARSKAWGVL